MAITLVDLQDPDIQKLVLELNTALQNEGFVRHGATMPADHAERLKTKLIPALVGDPTWRIFIAYDDAGVGIGIAACQFGYSTYWCERTLGIQDLWVKPGLRKLGFGEALVLAAIDYARAQGCCRVELSTSANNAPAAALYAKLGFNGEPELVADKTIAGAVTNASRDPSSVNVIFKLPLTY